MSYFPSRHLKTQKKLDRLKNQHTELLRSHPSSKQNLNETIISEFVPCNQSIQLKEQDNFQDKHIFASRSHLRSLSGSKHYHSIKKRKQTFFMSVCSVRDIKQPLKADIIKIPYNTPLDKIKSQKAKFPLNYKNIKFNHSRERYPDHKVPNQTKNSLVEMIQRKVSNKLQNKRLKNRPSTAVQTKRPDEVINDYRRSLLTVKRSLETKSAVGQRRYLKRENMQDSLVSLSRNKVKLNKNRQSFTIQPWQSNQ